MSVSCVPVLLKTGDTFGLAGPGLLPAGTWSARSQVRAVRPAPPVLLDGLVAELEVLLAPTGEPPVTRADGSIGYPYLLSLSAAPTSTSTWPIGDLECDVEFTDTSGQVRSSQTFAIKAIKDVTRAAVTP